MNIISNSITIETDPNKIIFLDVDGVLNAPELFKDLSKKFDIDRKDLRIFNACSPVSMSHLRWIIRETGARIVWSSTWRLYLGKDTTEQKILEGYFTAYDIPFPIEKTPILSGTRGSEIKQWIQENNFQGKFIILDDDRDMDDLMPWLIPIDGNIGLTKADAIQAINMLNL